MPATAEPAPGQEREADLFRLTEDISEVGSWVWRAATGVVSWSDQMNRIFGTDPTGPRPTSASWLALIHPADRKNVTAAVRAAMQTGGSYAVDHRVIRPDGQIRLVHTQGRSGVGADGAVSYLVGIAQDVTAARQVSGELSRARDLFAGVLDAATEQSIIGIDPDGIITVFNKGAERMLGYSADELVGHATPLIVHDPVEIRVRAVAAGVRPGYRVIVGSAAWGEPDTRQWTYVTKDGRRLQAIIAATAMRGPNGDITGFITVGTDITARGVAERALRASEALFQDIFDNVSSGILLAEVAEPNVGRLLRVNPAMSRITGYRQDQLMQMSIRDLTHPESQDAHRERFASYAAGDKSSSEAARRWVHADGRDIWVQLNFSRIHGDQMNTVVGSVEDITARKQAEDRLNHLALHDSLTGLPNRLLLLNRLEHALNASGRSGRQVAVLYLDLDGFKTINDEAGHLIGDEILVAVAARLRHHVRPGDTVGRIGGDEFVVVCPDFADPADADLVAKRLLAILAEPYPRGRLVYHLSASIGVASSLPGTSAQALMRDADDAMYAAKEDGRNRVRRSGLHNATSLKRTARAARYLHIEAELLAALDRDEFLVYGQPVVSLGTGRVVAVETLIRWEHPTRGLLLSGDFLDVAENTELMARIGQRVLLESCRIATGWRPAAGSAAPQLYVNVSGRQLQSGNLRRDVLAALHSSGLPASRLVLELTETFTPLLAGSILEELGALRQEGVGLAIDDVGTGYSSLARLTELPIDLLKIDRSFVNGIGQNPACDAVVKAILSIGESLTLQVVAEGVDNRAQARRLGRYGCRTAQGLLYSPALSEHDLLDLLDRPAPWATVFQAN